MKSLILVALFAAPAAVLASVSQDQAEPYATMSQGTVTLHPSNATFQIPDEVFTDRRTLNFSRYLSRAELAMIKDVAAPNWDEPYSRILNAVLPFESLAVHVGTEPWGPGSKSFGDLQVRVYVLAQLPQPARDSIGRSVLAEATKVFPPATALFPAPTLATTDTDTGWSLSRINYVRRGTDFSAGVNLDFYVRDFGNKTVVLAIISMPTTTRSTWEPQIRKIIDSFVWPK